MGGGGRGDTQIQIGLLTLLGITIEKNRAGNKAIAYTAIMFKVVYCTY